MKVSYQTRKWFVGLTNAILGSIAIAIPLVIVDPKDFNPFHGGSWVNLGGVVIASALVGMALYFRNHPIPDPEKDIDAQAAAAAIVEKVTEKTDKYTPEDIQRGLSVAPRNQPDEG